MPCPNPDKVDGLTYRLTEDADARHVYHNVMIAINPNRELNNGLPSSLAFWIDMLELKEGDQVFHLGCGVGYYTAIMAHVVGSAGGVYAVEIDTDLAGRARANLQHLQNVQVIQGNGLEQDPGPVDAILVNAGVTHPQTGWLDRLRPGGRLIFPLTATGGNNQQQWIGGMVKVVRESNGLTARFISGVGIFPCLNGRDPALNERLRKAFRASRPQNIWQDLRSLRQDDHTVDERCWFHTDTFCFSTSPVTAS